MLNLVISQLNNSCFVLGKVHVLFLSGALGIEIEQHFENFYSPSTAFPLEKVLTGREYASQRKFHVLWTWYKERSSCMNHIVPLVEDISVDKNIEYRHSGESTTEGEQEDQKPLAASVENSPDANAGDYISLEDTCDRSREYESYQKHLAEEDENDENGLDDFEECEETVI